MIKNKNKKALLRRIEMNRDNIGEKNQRMYHRIAAIENRQNKKPGCREVRSLQNIRKAHNKINKRNKNYTKNERKFSYKKS